MRRLVRAVAGLAVLVAAAAGLTSCGGGGAKVTFRAVFASGQGLYPGSNVEVLGLKEGSVQSVQPEGDKVLVTMSLPASIPVPAGVYAAVEAPELLGQRSVDLEPGYTGGPKLASGALIPESRTSVPVETNTILREVTNYLKSLQPANVHNVVSNLAADLNGQGQALGDLIGNAAATISLLAQKGNELGQLNGTLAQLTGTLDSRTSQIQTLIADYNVVSGVVAQDRVQLDGAIAALSSASTQLAELLNPNLAPLKSDLNTLTTVGRTLDRNLGSLDQGLTSSVALFAGAKRAYDPTHKWLVLNNQAPSGDNGMVLADNLRDRLAGICRRLLAHHSAGLSASQLSTLRTCGNPASGFFDQVLGLVPTALNLTPGATVPTPSTESVYSSALSIIPGLTSAQRQNLAAIPLSSAASGSSTLLTPVSGTGTAASSLSPKAVAAAAALAAAERISDLLPVMLGSGL
jgi:phospholipid/cholesterol/gamma-HCH transport system substrate-binding protein